MKIYFNSRDEKYKEPFGAVATGTQITFRIEAPEADGVVLRLWRDNVGEDRIEMKRHGDIFTCEATMPDEPGLVWYYFLIYKDSNLFFYGNNQRELGGEGLLYEFEPPSFQITVHKPFHTPDWFKHAIVYYIFPDRFNRGSDYEKRKKEATRPSDRKGPGQHFVDDWHTKPEYDRNEDGTIKNWDFYGGTLEGIIEKLPYIRSLGADAIYLCPIFEAESNHRYDTGDYMSIDPLLGDEETFRKLCKKAEDYRISIILDGVFSHTGADSIYFDKYGNYGGKGAYNNPDSSYYNWYTFYDDGTYATWWGDGNLPNVVEEEPSHKSFICGKKGVLNKWLDAGAKGWRLDVADELPPGFIKAIRKTIKSRKDGDDLVLIGEVWEDASNKISYDIKREYLLGDELDGTMNYPFRRSIIDFLMNRLSADDFCSNIMSIVENYPKEAMFATINILGSHDRTRPLTELSIAASLPEDMQSGFELKGIDYDLARRRLKVANILQYILPGVPVIYYGDEAGLQGNMDPYNRASYPWEKEDSEILSHYKKLGLIYKQHPALHTGNLNMLTLGEDVVEIIRKLNDETIVVFVNRNWKNKIIVSVDTNGHDTAIDLYNGEEFDLNRDSLMLSIEPTSARIIYLS